MLDDELPVLLELLDDEPGGLLPMPEASVVPELDPVVIPGVEAPAVPMSELPLREAPLLSLAVLLPLVPGAVAPAALAVRDEPDVSMPPVLAQAPSRSDAAASVEIAIA